MFSISLSNAGKKFNKEWIFKGINTTLTSENNYAVLGRNGSGKSTFLQLVAGKYIPNEGDISYNLNGSTVTAETVFEHLSICAPYLDIYEEFSLREMVEFQSSFKPLINGIQLSELPELLQLPNVRDRAIKTYSSGMKQRVKLGLAILADCPVLLLDEPGNNLDKNGLNWYNQLIEIHAKQKLIIVCSNHQENEHGFCNKTINIEEFK